MNRHPMAAEETLVRISAGAATLEGDLVVPPGARGIVLFAHGSGSSRAAGQDSPHFDDQVLG